MLTSLLPTTLPALCSWLIQSTLLLGAGWLFYLLVLRQERCFQYNRRFLLLAPWLALVLPPLLTLTIPWLQAVILPLGSISGKGAFLSALLPEVQVTANGTVPVGGLAIAGGLPLVYGVVVLALLARLGAQVLQLWRTTRSWPRESRTGYTLVFTGGRRPVSSFGRWVFWDETSHLTPPEAEAVLAHEVAHVRQGHTRARLLLEVARALLWACPVVHFFPRALELTHEFLADAAALRPTVTAPEKPAESYAALLARLALRQLHPELPLTHSFTNSLTLTRIRMLTSQSPVRRWKQWLALPLSVALLGLLACEKSAELSPPPPPPPTLITTNDRIAPPPPPQLVYTYVEQMPEYAGGQEQLLRDIAKQVTYPAAAKAAGLEGRVFVKFIVAEDGSIQAVHLQKGIPAPKGQEAAAKALDEAALAAVKSLNGRWTPGRQDSKPAAVFYTVPISFAL
ncbi:TonB family protein [Hymenobacter tenuis]